jgi:hypothetical protein
MPLIILIEFIQGRWKSTFIKILPFVAIAGIYLWLRATVLNFAGSFNFYQQPIPFDIRLATFFSALAWYVGFILFPYQLRVERVFPFYDLNTPVITTWNGFIHKTGELTSAYDGGGWGGFISPFTFAPWIGMMIFLFAVMVFFKYLKTKPLISFGIGWFFISWLPMANLFNMINSTFYEHFMYVPIMGFLIMVFGIYKHKDRNQEKQICIERFINFGL